MTKGFGVPIAILALACIVQAQTTQVVKEITIRGNSQITTEFIRANLRSKVGQALVQADLFSDENALRNLGVFKEVRISSRNLNDSEVEVIVDIVENSIVKEISVEGNGAVKTAEILKLITQESGKILNLIQVQTSLTAIRSMYFDKGFAAQVAMGLDPLNEQILVVRVIEAKVADVTVTGVKNTKRRVIDRLIKSKPGDYYNEFKVADDYQRLLSTRWFSEVRPARRFADDDPAKALITFDVKEVRTAQFDVGASLDPRSRLAGTFKISDSNFRGSGQSISASYLQDTFGSGASVTLDFVDPFFDYRDTTMAISLYSRVNSYFSGLGSGSSLSDEDRYDERRNGGSLDFSRPTRGFDMGIGFSFDTVKAINFGSTTSDFIRQDGTIMRAKIQAARDRRNVPLDASEGDYLRFSIEPGFSNIDKIGGNVASVTNILGNKSFIRATGEYKTFSSKRPTNREKIFDARKVVAARVRVGSITGTVPFYEQLFMGGSDSLRGYADQRFWGKTALLASVEYRYPIQNTFSVIGFADYGGAWGGYSTINDFEQSDKFKMNLGYGVGVGFRTPLGPIRIDFGFRPGGGSRTHFAIGGSF